jgi:hypothetical protein
MNISPKQYADAFADAVRQSGGSKQEIAAVWFAARDHAVQQAQDEARHQAKVARRRR